MLYRRDAPEEYPEKVDILSDAPLFDALQNGDKSTFERLVEEGADVNICDERGVTPLHYAAYEGLLPQVRLLLQHGADANAQTKVRFFDNGKKRRIGETPIEWAVQRVNNKVITSLLVPITNDSAVRRALRLSKWRMAMMRGDAEKTIQILDKTRAILIDSIKVMIGQ
jgi:ankyrin repeat protein